jgi:general secretion pathway protein K
MMASKRLWPTARQHGAALLSAMLTVTLVATLAATSLWRQWRHVEVETAERTHQQTGWLLVGALDWARLILREDARSSNIDHLAEPWAISLQESRLSSFLASGEPDSDQAEDAFLSGQITDLQSRLNVLNLVDGNKVSDASLQDFGRLFALLGLPVQELLLMADNLRAAAAPGENPAAPLLPQRIEQLTWLGLSANSLHRLAPYITLLPERTPVNLNTASPEVIYACVMGLDMAQAQRIVAQRRTGHFRTLVEANNLIAGAKRPLDTSRHSVSTRFFEIRGRIRYGQSVVEDSALVQRDGQDVKVLWRISGVSVAPVAQRDIALQ